MKSLLLSLVVIFIGCKAKNESIEMDKINERATIVQDSIPFGKADTVVLKEIK